MGADGSFEHRFMEHRWGTRVELDAAVDLVIAGGRAERAVVANASLSGAFVKWLGPAPFMGRVALRPVGAKGEWLEGCVVRLAADGFGIEWLDPGLQPIAMLKAMRRDALPLAPRPPGETVIRGHEHRFQGGP